MKHFVIDKVQKTMSQKSDQRLQPRLFTYKERLELLKNKRHSIKKKRTLFDESKDRFGFDRMNLLTKVKNTSEVKGYPFEVYNKDDPDKFRYALKIVPTELKFDKNSNPSTLEIQILKNLTQDLVEDGISPNIVYYLTNMKLINRCQALKCIDLKRLEAEDRIRRNSYVLVSEFIDGSSMEDWIYERCDEDREPSHSEWLEIVFQILYTTFVMQDKYKLMHNDMHYGNILMDTTIKPEGYFVYKLIDKNNNISTYYIKNRGLVPKLWDFEFAMMYSDETPGLFPNQFVIGEMDYNKKDHKTIEVYSDTEDKYSYNMPVQFDEIYDSHYFLCSLLEIVISQEMFDWIVSVFPEEVIPPDESTGGTGSPSSSYTETSSSQDMGSSFYTESSNDASETSGSEADDQLLSKLLGKTTIKDKEYTESYEESNDKEEEEDEEEEDDDYTEYLDEGRLINHKADHLKIPTTYELLRNPFFDALKERPKDFQEATAVYFEYKIKRH